MDVHEGLIAAQGRLPGAAVTIGNFDGVHLGHRRLIERAIQQARVLGTKAAVLTFWPHPARILAPTLAPPLISSRARRLELLAEAGLDAVIEQPFDRDFASASPADFTRLLLEGVGARAIVVGYDFTYGRRREGNVETLRFACDEHGASLEIVPPVSVDGLVVSSTKIREFVLAGHVEAAKRLLSRPFEVEGAVAKGAGRGRTIGVPTANVAVQGDLLPAIGVYAVRVKLPDGRLVAGACNVGLNPTFRPDSTQGPTANAISVEVHLLDFEGDLYGQELRVLFEARLRAERRFPGVDALVAQIREDIVQARAVLARP